MTYSGTRRAYRASLPARSDRQASAEETGHQPTSVSSRVWLKHSMRVDIKIAQIKSDREGRVCNVKAVQAIRRQELHVLMHNRLLQETKAPRSTASSDHARSTTSFVRQQLSAPVGPKPSKLEASCLTASSHKRAVKPTFHRLGYYGSPTPQSAANQSQVLIFF